MKKLIKLLEIDEQINSLNTGKRFISLECRCAFKEFDETNENWDEVWTLRCEVPNNGTGLYIRGKSYEDVMERTKAILESGYGRK